MTSTVEISDRLRSAKPSAPPIKDRDELWQQIVRTPSDPRLTRRPQSWIGRSLGNVWRRPGLLIACALVIAGCGTGVTVLTDSLLNETPSRLFVAAPEKGNPLWGPHRHLQIIRTSIRMVQSLTIPDVGAVQYWVARTRLGGQCEAFRLPDGGWAGTGESPTYSFGGITPTCSGVLYSQMGSHFAYDSVTFGRQPEGHPGLPGPRQWTVVFGIVQGLPRATTVREIGTGASARIHRGGYFALVVPEHLVLGRSTPGGCSCGPDAKTWFPGTIQLQAVGVLATSQTGQGG